MRSRSLEAGLLSKAESVVNKHVARFPRRHAQEARFQLLEGVASRLGGFELTAFQRRFNHTPLESGDSCMATARRVIEAISGIGIAPALAVSALAREALEEPSRRNSGAYHTDFRLAAHLARRLAPDLPLLARVIDPASGAGILLTALMIETCGGDRHLAAKWLSEGVSAADVSPNALRGCLLSLACLTDDLDALVKMRARWLLGDSLMCPPAVWERMAPGGFDAVIGNPPWEKVKLTRHEYLRANGDGRHYGADYAELDLKDYIQRTSAVRDYARAVGQRHESASLGEADLFVAFADLAQKIVRPGGQAVLLVPAGLIRSKSTEPLRRQLARGASKILIEIFENRARFFEIDTRFKFLCVHWRARATGDKIAAIELAHGRGTDIGVQTDARVAIGRATLARLRPDLSIPEVRSEAEWQLFCRMSRAGTAWSRPDSAWHPEFMREVDMTRDRQHFLPQAARKALPLVEGRMVHQHRFGAKTYVEGTGRSAIWNASRPGDSRLIPQFYIAREALARRAKSRSERMRAGFCDITGQTNERSCLAAMVPAGVVCGNKVPTILFPNDPSEDRLWLWVAIANSLPFDWLLRRIITTTINYFHLLSVRLPAIEPESLPGRKLVEIAKTLNWLDCEGSSTDGLQRIAELRCLADRLVLTAYGLDDDDLDTILHDFPLLDRTQPILDGEACSTVTRDLLFTRARDPMRAAAAGCRLRVALDLGAVAYLPAQSAAADRMSEQDAARG